MDASNMKLKREIEAHVGPLPPAYLQLLEDGGGGRTAEGVCDGHGVCWPHFYRLDRVRGQIEASPVDWESGLLIVAGEGPLEYVFDLRSDHVYLWDPDVNDFGASPEQMRLIDSSIEHFIGGLRFPEHRVSDPNLERLSSAEDMRELIAFLNSAKKEELRALAERTARSGRADVLRACMAAGCDTRRLLSLAVRGGNLDVVRFLVEECHEDLNQAKKDLVLSTAEVKQYFKQHLR